MVRALCGTNRMRIDNRGETTVENLQINFCKATNLGVAGQSYLGQKYGREGLYGGNYCEQI